MIKILTAQQIKALDAYTIQHEPIASIDLMERACRAFMIWFTERFDGTKKVGVVCGTGNNGGDGLCIARLLKDWGYDVKVWIVRGGTGESEDFKENLGRLKEKRVEQYEIYAASDQGLFTGRDILIDAIFGSGLSRPAEGVYAQVIDCINNSEAVRVAVDLPSGIITDKRSTGAIVRADYTLSFQLPKLPFFFPQYAAFIGEWRLLDIGLNKSFIRDATTSYFYTSTKGIRKILKPRSRFDHKGTFGHALLVSGSYGKMGAAVMAARGCLRAGVGLLTAHIPKCGYTILQVAVPEAMAAVDEHELIFTGVSGVHHFDAIGLGPGLGQARETVDAFRALLEQFRKPMVIDADGLNMLASNRKLIQLVPEESILTPHPKEFERLVGPWRDDFERLEKQKELASQLKSVIILKGAYTSVAAGDGKVYFNSTGNPGMAKGGSGDVLTGILTGLLAQEYTSLETALLGVYVHGSAGDFAAREKDVYGMTPSDIIESLPTAFRHLSR